MKPKHRQHANNTVSSIIYLAVYLPLLACAIVSIPFGRQTNMAEQNQLQAELQNYTENASIQNTQIHNLNIKLEFFKNENIKKKAAKLGLKQAGQNQVVYLHVPKQALAPAPLPTSNGRPQTFETAHVTSNAMVFKHN